MSSSPNPPFYNRFMMTLLRSPLHGAVSKGIMIISMTGRKSGRQISTPVSYYREGNVVTATTNGKWWHNLQGGQPVTLLIQRREYRGTADVITDHETVTSELHKYLVKIPGNARFFNVTMDAAGQPNPADVQRAARDLMIVKVSLD